MRKSEAKIKQGAKNWQSGRIAETISAIWLRLKGYQIIERRWSCAVGEIDLIARRGETLAFIEVKYRNRNAENSISISQRRRICRAAQVYLSRQSQNSSNAWGRAHCATPTANCRMDAILIEPYFKFMHIVNAWQCDTL